MIKYDLQVLFMNNTDLNIFVDTCEESSFNSSIAFIGDNEHLIITGSFLICLYF